MAKAAEAVKIAHELLTMARDRGCENSAWDAIFETLRDCPGALARPEPRKMNLLHQAAYWGHGDGVKTLLEEFGADPEELTADGSGMDAAAVAEAEGHAAVAAQLREAIAAKKAKLAAGKAAAEPSPEDVALAHKLLSLARDAGGEESTWAGIFEEARARPMALVRPAVRKYSLLHQAAYWNQRAAVQTLLDEFKMDPSATTGDEEALDAAQVAEATGYQELADWIREHTAAGPAAAGAAAAGSDEPMAAPADDVPTFEEAKLPYKGQSPDAVAALKGSVQVWLRPLAVDGASEWRVLPPAQCLALQKAAAVGEASKALGDGGTVHFGGGYWAAAGEPKLPVRAFRVLWEWDGGEGGKAAPEWRPYPEEAQLTLEAAICARDESAEVAVAPGKKYVVDLVGLRQYSSKDTFKCRRVRRQGVALREPYPKSVRDVKSGAWLDLAALPPYWEKDPSFFAGVARRFDLPMESAVASKIAEWMNSTIRQGHAHAYGQVPGHGGPLKGVEVVRIEVVMAPMLWRRYCCYRGKLKAEAHAIKSHAGTKYLKSNPMAMPACDWLDSDVCEAYFWHGSGKSPDGSVDLIDAIVSVGHEPSEENSEEMAVSDGASSRFAKTTSMFGAGVYLADIASKANLYVPCPKCYGGAYFRDPCHCSKAEVEKTEPYRMLLCRAALGRVHVEKKYSEARYKGEFNPAKKLGVDSVLGEAVKGTLAFREYVVYNDSASYPEFIVHYWRRSHPVKGMLPGAPAKKKKIF